MGRAGWHHAAGAAVVVFDTVGHRLPGGFRLHPDGKNLKVSGRLAVGGAHIPVSATAALGVSGSGISVTPVHVGVPDVITRPPPASLPREGQ